VRGAGEQLLRRDTVVLIASDGLDAGGTAALKRAMRTLRAAARRRVAAPHAAETALRRRRPVCAPRSLRDGVRRGR